MDEITKSIRKERESIQLIPKSEVLFILKAKLDKTKDEIPDLILRLTMKAILDLDSSTSDDQWIACIHAWSKITNNQTNPEIKFFMNGIGSILMRVEM